MNPYQSILQRLYSRNIEAGVKLGLANIQRLNDTLGHPYRQFRCIHIAGTNGKGSVATKIAKGLESSYSKVGLFTSPHISSFRERIQINGSMISEEEVSTNLQEIFSITEKEKIPATFFEITTQLAFQHFAKQGVDIAVLETGLGGRLDATNIVTPILSVITSIHLEHTEFLGDTLEKISMEKAGIIKPEVPVVLGPSAVHILTLVPCHAIRVSGPFTDFEMENRAIARAALEQLKIPKTDIEEALTKKPPCRVEAILYQGQKVILDVAHNPEALSRLFQALEIPKNKLRLICGLGKRKDLQKCLRVIDDHAQHIHLVDAPNGRCAPPHQLQQILNDLGRDPSLMSTHDTVKEGISCALSQARESNQQLLVCGTFFIMCDVRKRLGIEEPRDEYDTNERL